MVKGCGMFSSLERLLAWRYMRSKRKEGFVSVITLFSTLGIMLGVATLILVTSLMNGIREEMLSSFLGIDGEVTIYPYEKALYGADALLAEVKSVGGVKQALMRIEGQVMVTANRADGRAGSQALGAQVYGIHAGDITARTKLNNAMSPEVRQAFSEGGGVILGQRLAENLGLQVGDSITLISPQGRATFAGMVPRIKSYPIAGTFALGMHALDASLVFIPYEDAVSFFALSSPEFGEDVASAIEIKGASPETARELAVKIAQKTGGKYRVYDWQNAHASVFAALAVQRNVMIVILALIIVVAAFNIISGLIMLVQGKGKEIAILRTMGATRGMILRIFLMSGMGIGVMGTLLGLVLGLFAALNLETLRQTLERVLGVELLPENIYFLSTLPTRTELSEVFTIVSLSLLLSFLATLYPAWRASSQQPADALRYE
jgi:lipoprotein-releasing system permease protein